MTVLKRFGEGDPGLLSFPMPGWTLALDFPGAYSGPVATARRCSTSLVVDNGGRVYLAKDSRVSPGMLEQMYPRLAEFREIRAEVDPNGVFASDLVATPRDLRKGGSHGAALACGRRCTPGDFRPDHDERQRGVR